MRILAISSQVAYGPVGNSAAVPALQAAGDEVIAVPTIILSNHPGLGKPVGLRIPAPDVAGILGALDNLGVLDGCAGVLTGYFASNDQIHGVARVIRRMKEKNPALMVLVDPVIGDGLALYVPLPVAEAVRDELLPLATIATPNRFELEWLSGAKVTDVPEAVAAARLLPVPEVLATSIPVSDSNLATLAVTRGNVDRHIAVLVNRVPHGTGDFLAGLYLSHRLRRGPAEALAASMEVLDLAISMSAGEAALDVAGALRRGYKAV